MLVGIDLKLIEICLEWFFYGKLSVLCQCALTSSCTLAKEVQLSPGPLAGLYTGIFAIYLQCPKKESRSASIVFYVICLLYVLSAVTVVSDLLCIMFFVSNNSICKLKSIVFYQLCRMLYRYILTYCQCIFAFSFS